METDLVGSVQPIPEGIVTTRREKRDEKVAEDKARRQRLDDPEVRAHLRQIHETIDSSAPLSPGVDAEALPGFLRERELEPGP